MTKKVVFGTSEKRGIGRNSVDEILYPLVRGDYVLRKYDNQIAQVRSIWWDSFENEFCMNLTVMNTDGHRIGRVSPSCGGPSTFEPAVTFSEDEFERIEGIFPMNLEVRWVADGQGNHVLKKVCDAKRLTFRKHPRKPKKPKARKPAKVVASDTSDNGSALSALGLRAGAEHIRDAFRHAPAEIKSVALEQARRMEEEAEKINSKWI